MIEEVVHFGPQTILFTVQLFICCFSIEQIEVQINRCPFDWLLFHWLITNTESGLLCIGTTCLLSIYLSLSDGSILYLLWLIRVANLNTEFRVHWQCRTHLPHTNWSLALSLYVWAVIVLLSIDGLGGSGSTEHSPGFHLNGLLVMPLSCIPLLVSLSLLSCRLLSVQLELVWEQLK